jgi:hypothetical protein
LLPPGLQHLGAVLADALVGGEHAGGHSRVAEELAGVALGAEPEPDGLAGVGDRRQAFELTGPGVGLDVEQLGPVVLLAADADDAAALAVGGHGHPAGVDEIDLGGQHAGAGPVGDDAPGVPPHQQACHHGPQPVVQVGEVGARPLQ